MTILREVLAEMIGMFVADLRLTLAILALVALTALLAGPLGAGGAIAGAVLVLGSLGLLVGAVLFAARPGPRRPPRP